MLALANLILAQSVINKQALADIYSIFFIYWCYYSVSSQHYAAGCVRDGSLKAMFSLLNITFHQILRLNLDHTKNTHTQA